MSLDLTCISYRHVCYVCDLVYGVNFNFQYYACFYFILRLIFTILPPFKTKDATSLSASCVLFFFWKAFQSLRIDIIQTGNYQLPNQSPSCVGFLASPLEKGSAVSQGCLRLLHWTYKILSLQLTPNPISLQMQLLGFYVVFCLSPSSQLPSRTFVLKLWSKSPSESHEPFAMPWHQ